LFQKTTRGTTDRFEDGLLKDVQAPRLQGNADGLLVLVVAQAPLMFLHLVDDALEPGINALLLLILGKLRILHPLLGVVVDTFG
jgi:hypothetical protein